MTEYEKLEVEVNLMGYLAKYFSQMNDENNGKESCGVTLEDMAEWLKNEAERMIKHFAESQQDRLLTSLSNTIKEE